MLVLVHALFILRPFWRVQISCYCVREKSLEIHYFIHIFISAVVLFAFREGDANMQSVWLCSRNDAIGNIAVMIAALGVFGTQSVLPDLIVALLMAGLGLSAGWSIIKKSQRERREQQ